MPETTADLKPGQRVTDADGSRATYIRTPDPRRLPMNEAPTVIVRYVGEQHESACPVEGLRRGWAA